MAVKYISNDEMKSFNNLVKSCIFSILWSLVKYLPAPWFNNARYLVLKMFCKKIKSNYIAENVTIWFPWNLEIGRNVSINNGCTIDATGGVKILDSSRIAPNVGIYTADHGYKKKDLKIREQGFSVASIVIGEDVWVGASTNITKDVKIGNGVVVGCSSVITKDIPDNAVVTGNPSKIVKYRE